jgi:hypothetical protein
MTAAGPQSNRSIESTMKQESDERPRSIVAESREAAFFVNDKPVKIDQPRPTVRAVCQAAGYDPERCKVYRLSQQDDPSGREIEDLDERLHATAEKPIYLRCEKKDQRSPIASVAPGTAGGAVGDVNRPLNIGDLDTSPSRPRDYARDVDGDAPGGPPRPM